MNFILALLLHWASFQAFRRRAKEALLQCENFFVNRGVASLEVKVCLRVDIATLGGSADTIFKELKIACDTRTKRVIFGSPQKSRGELCARTRGMLVDQLFAK